MKKRLAALLGAVLAMSGCASNLVGPQDDEAHLQAKKSLEAAAKAPPPSMKLSAN